MERITLEYPIRSAQRGEVREVEVRRPTVGDHLRASKSKAGEAEREIALLRDLTGLTPDEFEQMDLSDYMRCAGVLEGFLGSTRNSSGEP